MSATRDGFSSSYGRFCTVRGRMERLDSATLRSMFIPKLTPAGQKALRDHYHFVRDQLQHYGVAVDESRFSGNGTLLMKKALLAGECDTIPPHILNLQEELHREWLQNQTPEQLAGQPEFILDKYFGSDRQQPDRAITTTVVGVPFPRSSQYRVGCMREAAEKVVGLFHELKRGPQTQTFFMGWDKVAVAEAAKGHASKEQKEKQDAEQEREAERAELHADYRRRAQKTVASPVGSYIVDFQEIEEQWPSLAEDLSIDIDQTSEPGIFKAEFDFGVLDGVMIIGADGAAVERYCSQADEESEEDWDEEGSSGDEDAWDEDDLKGNEGAKIASKRKTPAPQRRGRPKKAKPAAVRTYQLKLKCRETGEGMIYSTPYDGTIKFKDGKFASFVGEADFPCVGEGVPFTARKVSDSPDSHGKEWADYSERQYERERVGRWH